MLGINILFPVLNEELRLEKGIIKTYEYCIENIRIPFKLTIVDNGSSDKTPEISKNLAKKYKNVEYIRIEEKGVGVAFKKGVIENEYDIIGYMDCDLSTDLHHLCDAINCLNNEGVDYVNGSRFSKQSNTNGRKWYRKITSFGLVFLLKALLKMKSSDAVCGFTFLKKEIADNLIEECSNEKGWFYTIELLLRAERKNIKIYDMPVVWNEDYNTTVKIWKTIKNYMINIFRLRRKFRKEGIL